MKSIYRLGAGALLALAAVRPSSAGDTLLIHGHIYTGNAAAPWGSALSVSGARIEIIGTDAAVLKHRGVHSRVIDLRGRTVIPGIVAYLIPGLLIIAGALAATGSARQLTSVEESGSPAVKPRPSSLRFDRATRDSKLDANHPIPRLRH